eukprot:9034646-Pyramimonas_sp.AAC.1
MWLNLNVLGHPAVAAGASSLGTLRALKRVPDPAKQVYLHASGPEDSHELPVAWVTHVHV